ncbi:LacI family transcriptional regulator [Hydrogenispora ethanolica]|uniref:LacI family transcriptional regulator n=1 Tax=Hydrogenispora ethanolica TaxID=1082276 RepID=A0A4R1RIS9_HYDET|nr:LacI family DNA-binding transcriptional regulator [Hydrogenispora ethanolica]TCL65899.1 LacI family transcriptional regulator [Hydrogenispora ethanolica]
MGSTIKDIARLANVSKATVSRVINNKSEGVGEETKQKILRIIEELNYRPSLLARGLVTKRTHSLGLIIPDITNPFFPQLARGAEDTAAKHGYSLFLCNSDNSPEKEQRYIEAFIEKRIDGVMLASSISKSAIQSQIQLLKSVDIPFTLLDRYLEGSEPETGVFLDNQAGAYQATDYLLKNGHRRIVFVAGPLGVMTSWYRFQGFQMAHYDNGVEIDYSLVMEGDYQLSSGKELVERLIEAELEFTAIFAGNDMMAIGALKALQSRGIKIPETVEVIGFDNIELSSLVEPALTTVAQPTYEMGVKGAQMLIRVIEGEGIPERNVYLKPELLFRATTRHPVG